jgi:hypothetical protein
MERKTQEENPQNFHSFNFSKEKVNSNNILPIAKYIKQNLEKDPTCNFS